MVVSSIGERRRYPRRSVIWAGELLLDAERARDCTVLDVSMGGAKIRLEPPPPVGAAVTLRSPHFGALRARVAWATIEQAGIAFDEIAETMRAA